MKVLGHIVSEDGIRPDPELLKAVADFLYPDPKLKDHKKLKRIQSFVGTCKFYRRCIENVATIARPLTNLNRKDQPFKFGEEERSKSFDALKAAFCAAATLAHPDPGMDIELHADASSYGLGAVLAQRQQGVLRPIAFANRLLSPAERNYTITEKECLAFVWAFKKFLHFVCGAQILVVTDHHALCWLLTKKYRQLRTTRKQTD